MRRILLFSLIIPVGFIAASGCDQLSNHFDRHVLDCGPPADPSQQYIPVNLDNNRLSRGTGLRGILLDENSSYSLLEVNSYNCIAVPSGLPSSTRLLAAADLGKTYAYGEMLANAALSHGVLNMESRSKDQFANLQIPQSGLDLVSNDVYATGLLTARDGVNLLAGAVYLIRLQDEKGQIDNYQIRPSMQIDAIHRLTRAKADGNYRVGIQMIDLFSSNRVSDYDFGLKIQTATPVLVANVALSPEGLIEVNPGQDIVFSSQHNQQLELQLCKTDSNGSACKFEVFDGRIVAPRTGTHSYVIRAIDQAGNQSQDYLLSIRIYDQAGIQRLQALMGVARTAAAEFDTALAVRTINEAYKIFLGFEKGGREYLEVYVNFSQDVFRIGNELRFLGHVVEKEASIFTYGIFSGNLVFWMKDGDDWSFLIQDVENRANKHRIRIGERPFLSTIWRFPSNAKRMIFGTESNRVIRADVLDKVLVEILPENGCMEIAIDAEVEKFACLNGSVFTVYDFEGSIEKQIIVDPPAGRWTATTFHYYRGFVYFKGPANKRYVLEFNAEDPKFQEISLPFKPQSLSASHSNSPFYVVAAVLESGKPGIGIVDVSNHEYVDFHETVVPAWYTADSFRMHSSGDYFIAASAYNPLIFDRDLNLIATHRSTRTAPVGLDRDPNTGSLVFASYQGEIYNDIGQDGFSFANEAEAYNSIYFSQKKKNNTFFASHTTGIAEYSEVSLSLMQGEFSKNEIIYLRENPIKERHDTMLAFKENGGIFTFSPETLEFDLLYQALDHPIDVCQSSLKSSHYLVFYKSGIVHTIEVGLRRAKMLSESQLGIEDVYKVDCGSVIFIQTRSIDGIQKLFEFDALTLKVEYLTDLHRRGVQSSFVRFGNGFAAITSRNKLILHDGINYRELDFGSPQVSFQSTVDADQGHIAVHSSGKMNVLNFKGEVLRSYPAVTLPRAFWLHGDHVFSIIGRDIYRYGENGKTKIFSLPSLTSDVKVLENKIILSLNNDVRILELIDDNYFQIGFNPRISRLFCRDICQVDRNGMRFVVHKSLRYYSRDPDDVSASRIYGLPYSIEAVVKNINIRLNGDLID